jgi:hypothetical protein
METAAPTFRHRSSSQLAKIDWPFLAFWLTYFSMILGLGYAIL